jgi:hypothetical protein
MADTIVLDTYDDSETQKFYLLFFFVLTYREKWAKVSFRHTPASSRYTYLIAKVEKFDVTFELSTVKSLRYRPTISPLS